MNYKVTNYTAHIDSPQKLFADVLEVPTGLVIKQQIFAHKARDLAWKLNHGRGFNGFTPEFFLASIPAITFDEAAE